MISQREYNDMMELLRKQKMRVETDPAYREQLSKELRISDLYFGTGPKSSHKSKKIKKS